MAAKLESQIPINAHAEKVYEIFCSRTHQIANICPKMVQSVDILQSEWGTEGSIIFWKYFDEGKACVSKEVIENVDKENYSITYKVLEGDILQLYKSFKFILQVSPMPKGGVANWTLKYDKLHDHIPDPNSLLKLINDMVKDIDAHLIKG